MPSLCVRPSVQNVIDMSDERTGQSMHTTLVLLVLVRCVAIVILVLVLSLVFAQKAGQQTSTPHPCILDWSSGPL